MTLGNSGTPLDGRVDRRLLAAVLIVLAVWSGLGARLFYLQVIEGDRYRVSAERNSVRTQRVDALRGRVFDRNGELLVDSRPAFDVRIVPYQTRSLDLTLERLAGLVGTPVGEIAERVGRPSGLRRFRPVMAIHDLDRDAMARVDERIWALPGVMTDVSAVRYYWYGNRASHLFGRLGEISGDELQERRGQGYRQGDVIGKQGIEALYDRELRGRSGGRNVLVDARGREIEVLNYIAPEAGSDVVLTLDMRLQRLAEEGLDALDRKGAVVALDPRNGEVLVLASRPSFDPNRFADGVDPEHWKGLIGNPRRPLLNRALQGVYPPGSTYKVVTALAGLERGVITPDFKVYCGGSYRLGRRRYRCWKLEGHGALDVHEAMIRSCDVFFYTVAHLLKPSAKQPAVNVLAHYARLLGLGSPTGIEVGHEAGGLVPTSEWKERVFEERWMDGETISVSIGQGANQWTPIQMAQLYGAIGSGGVRYRPRVVRRVVDPEGGVLLRPEPEVVGEIAVSPRNLAIVRHALRGVVNEPGGTAYWALRELSNELDVEVAGKTGTAQVIAMPADPLPEEEIPEQYRDHAWFAAFAPADDPRIAIAVLVEHGGHGGSTAGPIAGEIIRAFFENEKSDQQPELLPSDPVAEEAHVASPEGREARVVSPGAEVTRAVN